MFVIWRRRKREKYRDIWHYFQIGDVRLTPVVVESRRVDGKPRQEHIAVLPSFIERLTTEGDAVWYWGTLEEKLARLSNRISPDEMEKIREAIAKKFPRPSDEFIAEYKAGAKAHMDGMINVLAGDERQRAYNIEANKRLRKLRDSLKTGATCADCEAKIDGPVYRMRRSIGRGMFGGMRFTTGVLCETCGLKEEPVYRYRRFGPCETCGREVFMSHGVTARRPFCSTRCAQAHYRAKRKAA